MRAGSCPPRLAGGLRWLSLPTPLLVTVNPRAAFFRLLAASCLAAACSPAKTIAQTNVPPADGDYAVPHSSVDVGRGRRLHLFCRGTGSVTVVFESGMGDEVWAWFRVHPEVAKVTRACVYDRAGYGFSDPPRRSGTAAHAVADLHALLGAARIAAPIVLVGQSYGGRIAQLYAYTHAKDISGLVLVDADHEDSAARGNKVTQGKLKLLDQQMDAAFEQCRAAAKAGLKEGTEAWAACVGDESAAYGPALWPAVKASRQRLSRWDALASERKNYDTRTAAELRAARRPFGDLPLIYLTRGVSPFAEPGKPQSALNKAFEDDVFKSHEDIARLSTRGENRVVAGAGHNIHMDNPQAVIDAVRAVIDMHSR